MSDRENREQPGDERRMILFFTNTSRSCAPKVGIAYDECRERLSISEYTGKRICSSGK